MRRVGGGIVLVVDRHQFVRFLVTGVGRPAPIASQRDKITSEQEVVRYDDERRGATKSFFGLGQLGPESGYFGQGLGIGPLFFFAGLALELQLGLGCLAGRPLH
jgi:hypothetical protein